jgi:peptidoglycan-N-acetylglucosamine deacetylase
MISRGSAFVSLTYDDALPCHFETVAPALEAHGLRGTFYVPCRAGLFEHAEAWRRLAAAGHELGNHTVFHPCRDVAWQDPAYNLSHYTATRWKDEVALANAVLRLIDGEAVRTFGNTCHHNRIGPLGEGGTTVEALAAEFFVAVRGEHTGSKVALKTINWGNLGTRGIDGLSFDALRDELEDLEARGGWMIYTLHGVGPRDHKMHLAEAEHAKLLAWLGARRETICTAPVRDVAARLRG